MVELLALQKELPLDGAKFSESRKYRYVLWRTIDKTKPMVAYIGLNPSTANEYTNDNTIKKLMKITTNNGFGGFYMLNLFGIVSANPKILVSHVDPIGMNDVYLKNTIELVNTVVCCWGSFKEAYKTGRAQQVMEMVPPHKRFALRISKHGRPWHPLYCFDNEKLLNF